MLTVQVSYKNSTDDHWDSVANYQTRRGANNFISKNKALYPADIFNIRIIGEEKAKPEFLNCSQATKIGDVFVEKHTNDWDDTTLYDAYVVVGFTCYIKCVQILIFETFHDRLYDYSLYKLFLIQPAQFCYSTNVKQLLLSCLAVHRLNIPCSPRQRLLFNLLSKHGQQFNC